MLCMNRPEGLGPMSTISDGLPTQCFFDVVLAPLPTWVLLLTAALCPLAIKSALGGSRAPPSKRWVRILMPGLYYFFVFVIVLMESVEIARLAADHLGIGLLPFIYVGCLVATALQATDGLRSRVRGYQVVNLVFWLFSLCVTCVKTAAVAKFGTTGPFARVDSAYPIEHQVTDLVILIIFYALLAAMELYLAFFKGKKSFGQAPILDEPGDKNGIRMSSHD